MGISRIIDARVRLPLEMRPKEQEEISSEYLSQYDAVLNLSSTRNKSFQDLAKEMVNSGIDHAVIHAEYEYGDPADAMNEAIGELVSKNPVRFSGFGTISMENLKPLRAVQQVKRIVELGLVGVNIQPSFFCLPIDDRRLYPVYAVAAEFGLAVAVHTGINYSVVHPIKNDHPLQVDQVACDFPELTIIACHAGWPWVPDMVAVLRKHPNVYVDFGGLSPKFLGTQGSGWEVMYKFMNSLLCDQILFATDWPAFPIERAVQEFKALGLKPEVLDKVLGRNAERLLLKK